MMLRIVSLISWALLGSLTFSCVQDYPATAPYTPPAQPSPPSGGLPPQQQPAPPNRRLFLSNDRVRVAIDLNMGGAINYLAEAGSSENMVNNNDLGRQLQTSIYSGPIPYNQNGKQPVEQWKYLGWNPVQSGDFFNNPARVVSYQQSGNRLYVKNIPNIWPLMNEPAECEMEHWIELNDNVVHVRARFTISRSDTTQYNARAQETPCVYLNGSWYRMFTYTGTKPFTNDAVSEFTDRGMTTRYGTENWVALLNDKGRGVGLYRAGEYKFQTAFFGVSRTGNEFDVPSGYMNSSSEITLDHNGQYEFEYYLIVGTLAEIRQFAYSQPRPTPGPNFRFERDRQGWYYYNANDTGYPINGELNVRWQPSDRTATDFRVTGPHVFWQATDVPKLYINAAFNTKATTARLSWKTFNDDVFLSTRQFDFPIIGDGQFRTYEVDLRGVSGWSGFIKQISLVVQADQYGNLGPGGNARIRSITATPNG